MRARGNKLVLDQINQLVTCNQFSQSEGRRACVRWFVFVLGERESAATVGCDCRFGATPPNRGVSEHLC
jgi:hypothetical protein